MFNIALKKETQNVIEFGHPQIKLYFNTTMGKHRVELKNIKSPHMCECFTYSKFYIIYKRKILTDTYIYKIYEQVVLLLIDNKPNIIYDKIKYELDNLLLTIDSLYSLHKAKKLNNTIVNTQLRPMLDKLAEYKKRSNNYIKLGLQANLYAKFIEEVNPPA